MNIIRLLRNTLLSYFDYRSVDIKTLKVKFAIIHIPDQIGDAMAAFPLIRSLESAGIDHLLVVASEMNKTVFEALSLEHTKLTIETMKFQDIASLTEIKRLAEKIKNQYGQPDLCIEAMRKKNLKTMVFISKLRAKTNLQAVGLTMRCYSPVCKIASRMDQKFRAPVPMTWTILMREAGFPVVLPRFELPLSTSVLTEVRRETQPLGNYIAFNFEGSIAERTFSRDICEKLITTIKKITDLPIVIVHSPKTKSIACELTALFTGVYRLSLEPSIQRSAAVIHDAYLSITPDTSILHMASAYNIPTIAVYSNYKTRWPTMQDLSEIIAVGKPIDHIDPLEFEQKLTHLIQRIEQHTGNNSIEHNQYQTASNVVNIKPKNGLELAL